MGFTILGLLFSSQNRYDVYPFFRLAYAPAIVLPVFALVSWITRRVIYPAWFGFTSRQKREILITTLVGIVTAFWLIPVPEADIPHQHHLIIEAVGKKVDGSKGTQVVVDDLRYLNQREVSPELIDYSSDWQTQGESLISQGASGSRLEIQGNIPGGLVVFLHYSPDAGMVLVTWDDITNQMNLFAREEASMPVILRGKGILDLPPGLTLVSGMIVLFYFVGVAAMVLAGLVLIYGLTGRQAEKIVYWFTILGITALFVYFKFGYLKFDQPHAMGDSLSYVITGEMPIQSGRFWMGLRPFTLPLAIKLMGININNYLVSENLNQFIRLQTIFSAVSWGVLAFSLARIVRKRWLSASLFGIVLAICLSIEVSLWDALLLAESFSFSLLVLMVTGWICLLLCLPNFQHVWLRWLLVAGSTLITLLYSFGRDSNVYYSVAAVAVLTFLWLIDHRLRRLWVYIFVYSIAVMAIFIGQYLSLSLGNRWQVFMYDQLGMRILLDPPATQFFAEEGLPVSENLMTITTMEGSQYQKIIDESSYFQPVQEWVNCCSKAAYIKYLVTNPLRTLNQPLQNWQPLLNSDLKGYRNPRNGIRPLPQKLSGLSNFIFPNSNWATLALLVLSLAGLVIYFRNPTNPVWIVIAVLVLPILPMMYMIWLGEPMEVDRHAAQLTIQLRLAGWLSLFLLVDHVIETWKNATS